jgi:hypothetical protein
MKSRTIKRLAVVLGAVVATAALAGTAGAVITWETGGPQVRVDKRTNDQPTSTSNTEWTPLPGASVEVHVPENESRLYDVPFFAESLCNGPNGGGACSVRIVAINGANVIPLNPASGIDYAFDSDMAGALDDLREGHAMERARRLPGGPNGANYQIQVQFAVTDPQTTFTLDDWLLAVYTSL